MTYKVKSKREKIPMYVIKAKNYEIGHHWFDKDTLRFFNSKIPKEAIKKGNHAYFITSETNPSDKTAFTIRKADLKTGKIDTEGEFFKFETRSEAQAELNKILK
jgi:hypothetical protein